MVMAQKHKYQKRPETLQGIGDLLGSRDFFYTRAGRILDRLIPIEIVMARSPTHGSWLPERPSDLTVLIRCADDVYVFLTCLRDNYSDNYSLELFEDKREAMARCIPTEAWNVLLMDTALVGDEDEIK